MEGKSFWLSLDSGAHSWYNKFLKEEGNNNFRGSEGVDFRVVRSRLFKSFLDRYIGYLHEMGPSFEFYVTLDVIGHAKYTWDILKYMESNGLHPIPAFHLGEDFSWLSKIVDNYDYFGVGIINKGKDIEAFKPWIKKVFKEYVQRPDGSPRVKVHGFAANALEGLRMYPFYSCDASTWSFGSRLGHIQVPDFIVKNNLVTGYNYFPQKVRAVPMTMGRYSDASHLLKLTSIDIRMLEDYLQSIEADATLAQAEGNPGYYERDYINAMFFINAEKELKKHYERTFDFGHGGNLYLAGTAASSTNTVPNTLRIVDRILKRENDLKFLLSYWYDAYANSNLAIKEYFNRGLLDLEHMDAMEEHRKAIISVTLDSRRRYEVSLADKPHLEDLSLEELNSSVLNEVEFKQNREEAPKRQMGFDVGKILERKKFAIKPRPMGVPQPPVEALVEEVTKVVELPKEIEVSDLCETEEDLNEYLNVISASDVSQIVSVTITPTIELLDFELTLPKTMTLEDCHKAAFQAIRNQLSSGNYKVQISMTETLHDNK